MNTKKIVLVLLLLTISFQSKSEEEKCGDQLTISQISKHFDSRQNTFEIKELVSKSKTVMQKMITRTELRCFELVSLDQNISFIATYRISDNHRLSLNNLSYTFFQGISIISEKPYSVVFRAENKKTINYFALREGVMLKLGEVSLKNSKRSQNNKKNLVKELKVIPAKIDYDESLRLLSLQVTIRARSKELWTYEDKNLGPVKLILFFNTLSSSQGWIVGLLESGHEISPPFEIFQNDIIRIYQTKESFMIEIQGEESKSAVSFDIMKKSFEGL